MANPVANDLMKRAMGILAKKQKPDEVDLEIQFAQESAAEEDRGKKPKKRGGKFKNTAKQMLKRGQLKRALSPFEEDFDSMLKKAK